MFCCSKHLIKTIRELACATVTVQPSRHGTDWRCVVCGGKAVWAVNPL